MLGAALLKAGKAADAEAIYRADLRRQPENGWGALWTSGENLTLGTLCQGPFGGRIADLRQPRRERQGCAEERTRSRGRGSAAHVRCILSG